MKMITDGSSGGKRTVADQISIELQRMIIEGEIDPGKPLPSQRDIANRFGASRTSVREAISALSAAGLVQVEHGRGVFVRSPSAQPSQNRPSSWMFDGTLALRDAYQIRALIEPFAVRIVTPLLSREHLARLTSIIENTESHLLSGDYVALAKEDFAFHFVFAELSGNQLFVDILSRCASLLPPALGSGASMIVEEHSAIIEEVAMGRGDSAAHMMHDHIIGAASRAGITLPAPSNRS
ncbi:FadR/GntR family transcriptional regulator [Terrihabitans sp. B22-R8]|uniref:FadR/GntR family transcriptional regulator n=1 Tax=Terrihabitans sp. B22-R8 TaxID=3425128 RepID=UPI00403D27CB